MRPLPVHWPGRIWASCDEPPLEAKDALSICEGTSAYSLFARQFVASIAMLAADRAPTSLTAGWNDRRQLERAPWNCSSLLGPTSTSNRPSRQRSRRRCWRGIFCIVLLHFSSHDKDTEPSDPQSRSEASPCDTCEASGRRACLLFRCLPTLLFSLFLGAVRPWASFAALAARNACRISSAACLKDARVSSSSSTTLNSAKSQVRSASFKRNSTQSLASLANSWQNSTSDLTRLLQNCPCSRFGFRTMGSSYWQWVLGTSNCSKTMSQGGLLTLNATTTCLLCPEASETHCRTKGWADKSRFKGSCTLTAVTKSWWNSRNAIRSSSPSKASQPPYGHKANKLSLVSGRSSSASTRSWWSCCGKVAKIRSQLECVDFDLNCPQIDSAERSQLETKLAQVQWLHTKIPSNTHADPNQRISDLNSSMRK